MTADARELARVRRLVHALACRDQMTPEAASERLTAYQIERSPAEVAEDLDAYACPSCPMRLARTAGPAPAQPEPVQPVYRPAVAAGWLTGMLGHDGG